MRFWKVSGLGLILFASTVVLAQSTPRFELGLDYSYARVAPSASYSQGHSMNGGGANITLNLTSYLGIRGDFQFYGSTRTAFNIPPSANFPGGATGTVEGNLYTYLVGPQIKLRSPKIQPNFHLLFGGAHTNLYANGFNAICQPLPGACTFTQTPSASAFAMAAGGGIDIPVGKRVAIRPAEIDYLMTRFTNPFSGTSNQNNFRYSAGVVFTFGNKD